MMQDELSKRRSKRSLDYLGKQTEVYAGRQKAGHEMRLNEIATRAGFAEQGEYFKWMRSLGEQSDIDRLKNMINDAQGRGDVETARELLNQQGQILSELGPVTKRVMQGEHDANDISIILQRYTEDQQKKLFGDAATSWRQTRTHGLEREKLGFQKSKRTDALAKQEYLEGKDAADQKFAEKELDLKRDKYELDITKADDAARKAEEKKTSEDYKFYQTKINRIQDFLKGLVTKTTGRVGAAAKPPDVFSENTGPIVEGEKVDRKGILATIKRLESLKTDARKGPLAPEDLAWVDASWDFLEEADMAKIDYLAQGLMKGNPNLTEEQAIAKANELLGHK